MNEFIVIVIGIAVLFVFILLIALFKRYKRCPSDRVLVIYGKVGKGASDEMRSAKCIHGGAAFIWPVIQDYQFLDLTPISIEINLTSALSRQNIRVDVPSRFTVGVSTEAGIMTNAAERLLGLRQEEINDLAKDIIFGQLRLVVATMDIEEINKDRDKFLAAVSSNVEQELKKIGLKLINVNITDINDESGYIVALGKEAAAQAINDAKKSVAERNRFGAIGEANALREQRVEVSKADAIAVEGENNAKIVIANSDADRREKEAEAERKAVAAEKVSVAKALEEAYLSEKTAEEGRAHRDKASQLADIIVPIKIDKEKIEIAAEAIAEQTRRHAKGDADAIYLKMEAEAKGIYEILSKQAEGFEQIVNAAGHNSKDAVMLMIADKLPELVEKQVEAIKNIKIDKVTVWDNLGSGKDGKSPATANFLSGMLGSIPPFDELFKMAGLELPDYLKGKQTPDVQKTEKVDEKVDEIKDAEIVKEDDIEETESENE